MIIFYKNFQNFLYQYKEKSDTPFANKIALPKDISNVYTLKYYLLTLILNDFNSEVLYSCPPSMS